jgi:hypothetical protein
VSFNPLALQPDRRLPVPPELSEEDAGMLLGQLGQALQNQGMYFDQFPHASIALATSLEMGVFRVGDSGALMPRSHEIENGGWEVIGFGLPIDPSRSPEAAVVAVWASDLVPDRPDED